MNVFYRTFLKQLKKIGVCVWSDLLSLTVGIYILIPLSRHSKKLKSEQITIVCLVSIILSEINKLKIKKAIYLNHTLPYVCCLFSILILSIFSIIDEPKVLYKKGTYRLYITSLTVLLSTNLIAFHCSVSTRKRWMSVFPIEQICMRALPHLQHILNKLEKNKKSTKQNIWSSLTTAI